MSRAGIILRCESQGIDDVWMVQSIDGLPSFRVSTSVRGGNEVFISMSGLDVDGINPELPAGNFFTAYELINECEIRFATFFCRGLVLRAATRQYYLVAVEYVDLAKLLIAKSWADGAMIRWSELDTAYGNSWLSASMERNSANLWVQSGLPAVVDISSNELRSYEDFYCYLGEQFFGYKGYAGRDLDGLFEVLGANSLNRVEINLMNEDELSKFLFRVTGQRDYHEKFKKLLIDAGAHIIQRGSLNG